jgi:hypothetical protein
LSRIVLGFRFIGVSAKEQDIGVLALVMQQIPIPSFVIYLSGYCPNVT